MLNLTRRTALLGGMGMPLITLSPGCASPPGRIELTGWRGGAEDFFRAPVLLAGKADAILIDGSFNYASGDALVAAIRATGKRLTTVYVTCNDPDYYFSLARIAAAFPDARIIAAPDTIALIERKKAGKVAAWTSTLGDLGPKSIDELVIPAPHDGGALRLEGVELEIVTSHSMEDRSYIWAPSLEAVVGGVYVFSGLHVWTADTPTAQDRANWIAELDAMMARRPKIVVAGHASMDVDNGPASLAFTRDYLLAYEEEVARAADSGALVSAMMARFPGLGLEQGLALGAKVAMGEMKWG